MSNNILACNEGSNEFFVIQTISDFALNSSCLIVTSNVILHLYTIVDNGHIMI